MSRRLGLIRIVAIGVGLCLFLGSLGTPVAEAKSRSRSRSSSSSSTSSSSSSKSSSRRPAASAQTFEGWTERVQRAEDRGEAWGALIQDLQTSRTVFEYCPRKRLMPASNRKLITFTLALEYLGADYTFKTEFGASPNGQGDQAHLNGDLILRSNGNPSLGHPLVDASSDPAALFKGWARQLRESGVAYVHGDLVLDATAFGADQTQYPPAWEDKYRQDSYAPVPTAIAVCENLLRISVKPAASGSGRGRLSLYPWGDGLALDNQTRTVESGSTGISAKFDQTTNQLVVAGRLRDDQKEEVIEVPMTQPLTVIGAMLRETLLAEGIRLMGQTRIETEPEPQVLQPVIGQRIGLYESPPLADLMVVMMRKSNNFLAEQIWRAAAAKAIGRGDVASCRRFEKEYYQSKGLTWMEPGWDGSGLSRYDRNTPEELVTFARILYAGPDRDLTLKALPLSGTNGTLRNRTFTDEEGRVAAKTGTLADVSALTGFILDRSGQPRYVFSIIGNAPTDGSSSLAARISELVRIAIRHCDNQSS